MSKETPDAQMQVNQQDKHNILLVDDDVVVSEAIRTLIQEASDLELVYCNDPTQAINTAEQVHASAILLDLVMPEIDGLTLLRYFRANGETKNIPILMLSTTDDPEVKAEAFANGANDYQIKIPDKVELLARVRYHAASYSNLIAKEAAYIALQKNQRQLAAINHQLEKLAALDGLTGISNRRFFNEQLDKEWRRSLRAGSPISVIMTDIDHFKLYNDAYGHLQGDDCLKQVARTIERCFQRGSDLVARYGGEEFVVVAPLLNAEQAIDKAEEMRVAIADLGLDHKASPTTGHVTVSVGVANCIPSLELSPTQLVQSADNALYEAKASGRNRVTVSQGPGCTPQPESE